MAYVILAERLEYTFEDIADDILKNVPIVMLTEADDPTWDWNYYGKWINEQNYDEIVAEYYMCKYPSFLPQLFVNAKIYEENSKVNIPAGKYVCQKIGGIKE